MHPFYIFSAELKLSIAFPLKCQKISLLDFKMKTDNIKLQLVADRPKNTRIFPSSYSTAVFSLSQNVTQWPCALFFNI